MALAQAGEAAIGATLYCSLEPCAHRSDRGPACSQLIGSSGITRVVYGLADPDSRTNGEGQSILRDAGIKAELTDCAACKTSLSGYLMRKTKGRPHVTIKLAMSLDGFLARPDGESQWITGANARAHVHSRRAMADAILVGGGTWRADKPRLDVRLPGLESRSPQRILLSRGIAPDGVKVINHPAQISALDGVQYLYVEGGAQTAASFLKKGLADRIEIYRAPIFLGSGITALGDYGLTSLAEAHEYWQLTERRMLGTDTYEAYDRSEASFNSGN
ncbi:bifunctional diaminohydroxyphosphoribosylaminopyrimidine deaminase/5-amino-6-(5-phosphoribosylamino)uracil reductase RibD [Pontixanthobacter gangjinensis]